MEFCDFCDNMYYIKQRDDTNTMVHYCKNCNNEKPFNNATSSTENENGNGTGQSSHKILTNNFEVGANIYKQYLNENIVYDHTIPHINNIICSNPNCTKPDDVGNDVMYIKYDKSNIKYLYHCVHCKNFWIN
jgi:DNA-directed RNA polymerase subunit M/transcription elongation factor TFIIS